MATKITESEDNSIQAIQYQGKPLSQWEKEFEGEFTAMQLFQLIRSGIDIGRIKLGLVDEADKDIDDPVFKGEEFFFNENHKDVVETADEDAALDESTRHPKDIVTVGDLVEVLDSNANPNDKVMFRFDKNECKLVDIQSKGGTTVVDVVDVKRQMDENEKESMSEGYGWKHGGYGGTGRSYSKLGSHAPRGEEIGWYSVGDLDPKAKGKMPGWRCGPAEFPFEDLLYPERKYVKHAMVMRNKYVQAGSMSGVKYIAVPSYFDAIKNNDEEAIKLLKALGIPLDLTFGMDPNDDYSHSYTVRS